MKVFVIEREDVCADCGADETVAICSTRERAMEYIDVNEARERLAYGNRIAQLQEDEERREREYRTYLTFRRMAWSHYAGPVTERAPIEPRSTWFPCFHKTEFVVREVDVL